jgi:hypothetical protein
MTPTLIGRWQTRVLMFGTIGVLITAIFALLLEGPFFPVLGYIVGFGLVWDVVYIVLQRLRWDRDWPAAFQVATGVWEGLFVYVFVNYVLLVPGIPNAVPLGLFVAQYATVWTLIFAWLQGPMRVVAPYWRFHGGRVIPAVSSRQRRR